MGKEGLPMQKSKSEWSPEDIVDCYVCYKQQERKFFWNVASPPFDVKSRLCTSCAQREFDENGSMYVRAGLEDADIEL